MLEACAITEKKELGQKSTGQTDGSTQCDETVRPEWGKKLKTRNHNKLQKPQTEVKELIFYQCISLECEDSVGYYALMLVHMQVQYRTQYGVKISSLIG